MSSTQQTSKTEKDVKVDASLQQGERAAVNPEWDTRSKGETLVHMLTEWRRRKSGQYNKIRSFGSCEK